MKQTVTIILLIGAFFTNNANAQMIGTPYILYEIPSILETCTADISTRGKDFWVTFGKNNTRSYSDALLELKIATAEYWTNITLTFTETGTSTTISNIPPYSLRTIDLSDVTYISGDRRNNVYITSNGISKKTLHITSTQPISVYAFNTSSATTDATIVMPIESWGRDYYRFSSSPYNSENFDVELIIAREATTLTLPNGNTQNLSAGEAYYNSSASDMTGRHITSDKPVAYFTHTTLTAVPLGRTFGDITFEQLMPVDRWGRQFLVPNATQSGLNLDDEYVNNSMNNLIRIVASEDSTKVNFSGATRFSGQNIASGGIINAGQYVELQLSSNTGACYIDADKPVGVCSYLVGDGTKYGGVNYIGDPAIAWIPAVNQTIETMVVAPFYPVVSENGGSTNLNDIRSKHYATIITKTATKTQTKINGTIIPSGWTDNIESGYSYYVKQFNNENDKGSVFRIENPNGIIVLCHGISTVESYYYNAGSGTCVIN